jgi:hypothetical protein
LGEGQAKQPGVAQLLDLFTRNVLLFIPPSRDRRDLSQGKIAYLGDELFLGKG